MPETAPPIPKKFLTNHGENTLSKRLDTILPLTRDFDCLVGYFFISGFFRLYPALETVEKIRILIGLKNEQVIHGLIKIANEGPTQSTPSTAEIKATFGSMMRTELVSAGDTLAIEIGVRKFVDLAALREIGSETLPRAEHPRQGLHHDACEPGERRKPRVGDYRLEQSVVQRAGRKSGVQCAAA